MQEPLASNSIRMDTRLSGLLCPIRDPTKNWEVNIAAALEEYLSKLEGLHLTFQNGCLSLNFAQAALIIQGSTSVYCKKVEYLCSLCQQVLHIISSDRRTEPQTSEVCKEKESTFSSSTCDDFCSLDDLKIQKGLDLAEDEHTNSNKRTTILPFTPVMLIRLEEREKGHIMLLNFKGEVIGNKQDYHLNTCELDDSGALSFPMPSSEYTMESTAPDFSNIPHDYESDDDEDGDSGLAAVDDYGVSENRYRSTLWVSMANYKVLEKESKLKNSLSPLQKNSVTLKIPMNTTCSPCPSNFDVPTEKDNISIPIAKDKLDVAIEKGNSNISKKKDKSDVRVEKVSSKPERKSLRHEALKAKRAAVEEKKSSSVKNSTLVKSAVAKPKKRKASKKSPTKLKEDIRKSTDTSEVTNAPQTVHLDPVEGFCCETFYSPKCKIPRIALKMPSVDILGNLLWEENPKVQENLKGKSVNQDESCEIHEDGDEAKLSDEDDNGCSFPGANDYEDDSPEMNQDENAPLFSSSEADKGGCSEVPNSEELTHKNVESYLNSIAHYCRTDDLTKKVRAWEERIKPILRKESRRETFDIHAYEGRVMKNFKDNSPKQTVSFSKICEGKQKWEVCRYFLASLQLANSYSVDIAANNPTEGSDMELILMS